MEHRRRRKRTLAFWGALSPHLRHCACAATDRLPGRAAVVHDAGRALAVDVLRCHRQRREWRHADRSHHDNDRAAIVWWFFIPPVMTLGADQPRYYRRRRARPRVGREKGAVCRGRASSRRGNGCEYIRKERSFISAPGCEKTGSIQRARIRAVMLWPEPDRRIVRFVESVAPRRRKSATTESTLR